MKPVSRLAAITAVAASLFAAPAVAASPTLSLTGGSDTNLLASGVGFDPGWLGGVVPAGGFDLHHVFEGATLHLDGPANVTYTFVGKEAGYTNVFKSFYSGYGGSFQQILGAAINLGQSISFANVGASNLQYGFLSNGAGSLYQNSNGAIGVALSADKKSALVFFNDSCACDKDYDDMVIKVSIAAVPEPETYAMLLAGLGIMGGIARRRRAKA